MKKTSLKSCTALLALASILLTTSCSTVQSVLHTVNSVTSSLTSVYGNSNFRVSVDRCYAKGSEVYVDMEFQNLTNTDIGRIYYNEDQKAMAYCSNGKQYPIYIKFANAQNFRSQSELVCGLGNIPRGLSVPVQIVFENVPTNVTLINSLRFNIRVWETNSTNSKKFFEGNIDIRGITIDRTATATSTTTTSTTAANSIATTTDPNTATTAVTTQGTTTSTTTNNAAASVINALTGTQNVAKRPKATVSAKPGVGDLGRFDLRGPVKKCVEKNPQSTTTYTFDKKGKWLTTDGKTPKQLFTKIIKRDNAGRIVKAQSNEFTYDEFTFNASGLLVEASYYSGEDVNKFEYDADGFVVKETDIYTDMGAEEPEITVRTFTVTKIDKYGNWLERTDNNGIKETRTLTYHDGTTSKPITSTATTATNATKKVAKGELPIFDVYGPVKTVKVWMPFSDTDKADLFEFNQKGQLIKHNKMRTTSISDVVGAVWGFEVKNGKLQGMGMCGTQHCIEWNYTYDENGDVIKYEEKIDTSDDDHVSVIYTIKILTRDSHGNWTKRSVTAEGETRTETRTITYYK